MKNEINEILNQLEYFNEEDYKYYSDFKLNRNQIKLLLDYITNLQEESKKQEELISRLYNIIEDDKENFKLLEEENKKLKELCNKYEEEHNNEFQCWKRDRKELLDKRTRTNKAIKYIKDDWYELNIRDIEHCINLNKDIRIDLLNILQGEDKK